VGQGAPWGRLEVPPFAPAYDSVCKLVCLRTKESGLEYSRAASAQGAGIRVPLCLSMEQSGLYVTERVSEKPSHTMFCARTGEAGKQQAAHRRVDQGFTALRMNGLRPAVLATP
jgi:hypothetical protein